MTKNDSGTNSRSAGVYLLDKGYDRTFDKQSEEDSAPVKTKTIGILGSFSLIFNNLVGPAMLGFPNLFQQAGLLPVVSMILLVYFCSSLCGTLLADAISSIPLNQNFRRDLDFSSAFHIVIGGEWYILTQTLFLISCFVQAIAAIVESAQSIDGILASFILGRTYALQLLPSIQIISWSPLYCHLDTDGEVESALEDCTPFHDDGRLLLTMGYAISTLIFLPLGRGMLKETVAVQIFALCMFFLLMSVFIWEFQWRGLDIESVPLVGSNCSQLAGVVLFNFAYTITVPSWLVEKKEDVPVNAVLWSATTIGSVMYVVFGVMGAAVFERTGHNVLVLLASSKVHHITRICSALFGLVIIGCGIPVFCVIIKNVLQHSSYCTNKGAFFGGAILPFLVAWTLYQGGLLMFILNWSGLIINGSVAFILPLILAYKTLEARNSLPQETHESILCSSKEEDMNMNYGSLEGFELAKLKEDDLGSETVGSQVVEDNVASPLGGSVHPLSRCLASSVEGYRSWIIALITVYCVIFAATIIIDVVEYFR